MGGRGGIGEEAPKFIRYLTTLPWLKEHDFCNKSTLNDFLRFRGLG